MPQRFVIALIKHETNTFSPIETPLERVGHGRGPAFGRDARAAFEGSATPMAALSSLDAPGVRVVVATTKCQTADQEMFRHVGIEPRQQRIVAVKSSVHFRADFQPIAREVMVVKAPGPALADPAEFAWKKLRRGMRLKPLGPVFT